MPAERLVAGAELQVPGFNIVAFRASVIIVIHRLENRVPRDVGEHSDFHLLS